MSVGSSGVDQREIVQWQRDRARGSRRQHNMQCIRHSATGSHVVQTRSRRSPARRGHREVSTGDRYTGRGPAGRRLKGEGTLKAVKFS